MTTPFLLKLYSNLETDYHLDDGMLSYFDDLSPETEEEKEAVSYEYCSLNYVSFDSILNSWDDETREKVATYLKSRIRKAKNKNLLLRYGLSYFSLTKDFKSLNDTIAIGVNILRRIVTNEDQAEVHTFTKWYKILYPISAKTAHFQDMVNLLKDALHANSAMFRYVVLGMIFYSDQKQNKKLDTDVPLPKPLQLGKNFNAAYLSNSFLVGFSLSDEAIKFKYTLKGKVCGEEFEEILYCIVYEQQYGENDFCKWSKENDCVEESSISKSAKQPEEKKIVLRNDHGYDVLYEHAKKLRMSPYVESIINSMPFNPNARHYIYRVKDNGIIELVLTNTDCGYGMVVQTTGRNRKETLWIAKKLKDEYAD